MPKPEKYHLQRLLEVRESAREAAVSFLAERRDRLNLEEAELEKRQAAVEICRQTQRRSRSEMLEKSKKGVKNSEMVGHQRYLSDLRKNEAELLTAVEQQKLTVKRAAGEVENARLALGDATREMRVIEKHRENWRREEKIKSGRREEKNNDELGALLHERRKIE